MEKVCALCCFSAVNLLSIMYGMNIYIYSNVVRENLCCWNLKYRVFVNHIMFCEEALFKRTG
jgi:hypothetical protein